ncbi:MAG: hypothetical protein LBV42_00345 [Methanobrevibacter sp.]|nr:hypothetical protein [Methanobrevibacter sp.]
MFSTIVNGKYLSYGYGEKYYFLSRPRIFGKNTISFNSKTFFKGEKEFI